MLTRSGLVNVLQGKIKFRFIKIWFKKVIGLLNNFLWGDQLMLKFVFSHVVNKLLEVIIGLLPLSTDQKPSQN